MARPSGALGEAMVRVAEDDPDLTVVTGADPHPLGRFAELWPHRLLTVGPVEVRSAVAEGVVRAGARAVVVLEGSVDLPVLPDVGVVLVSTSDGHLAGARRAVLALPHPVLLHLPDLDVLAGSTSPPDPPDLDGPRVLRRGRGGVVIGAGPTARVASWIGAHLSSRMQRQVTTLDLTLITPASEVDPVLLRDHLLVGPADSPRPAAMTAVPVAADPTETAARVTAALGR